jgi:flagellar hook protein FlgE
LTPGVLEGSNVDIASEFTRLITAQRGFQVNARVIQTTDSILQELATLIR